MAESNNLGLDTDDRENLKNVIEDLMDIVVKYNSRGFTKDEDFAEAVMDVDNASFIIGGIMYKHGMDLCAGFHEEFPDGDDGVE